jgi:hypothetical protein
MIMLDRGHRLETSPRRASSHRWPSIATPLYLQRAWRDGAQRRYRRWIAPWSHNGSVRHANAKKDQGDTSRENQGRIR